MLSRFFSRKGSTSCTDVPLATFPVAGSVHADCVQRVRTPHRQWIALHVRQAAFNPFIVLMFSLSIRLLSGLVQRNLCIRARGGCFQEWVDV